MSHYPLARIPTLMLLLAMSSACGSDLHEASVPDGPSAGDMPLQAFDVAPTPGAIPQPTSAPDPAPQPQSQPPNPQPELLVAHGAFARPADRERFEAEVLPSARAFLAYWADVGLHVPHGQARIYISPPPESKSLEALPQLYGETIFDELRALETRVASAATNKAALDVIDAFACAYPPLHRRVLDDLENEVDRPDITPTRIAQALKQRNDELSSPEGTFSFHADNGEFELPLRRTCSYILAGYATDKSRAHPFLEKDLIQHELGHALHYGLWLESGVLGERLSSSANEAVADILAHVFDGDPCHGKVLDAAGQVVGCRRTMQGYESSVSDAVWRTGSGGHASGQSLRDLVWTLRTQVQEPELKQAIRQGIAAIQPVLNTIDREPLSNVPVFDDEILGIRYRFAREYEATNAFFNAVCARLGKPAVCDEQQARIGDPRLAMRAAWLSAAPTAIGPAGLQLADGRRVAFEVQAALLPALSVTELDGTVTRYERNENNAFDRDQAGRVTLWFGTTEQAGWTSDATLSTRPADTTADLNSAEPVLPAVTGDCPEIRNGITTFGSTRVSFILGDDTANLRPMFFYWYGTGGDESEVTTVIPESTRKAITDAGGVLVAFANSVHSGTDLSGTQTWTTGDVAVFDQVVACAARDVGIDSKRIYVTGSGAGGFFAAQLGKLRSSYVAAVATNSGGIYLGAPDVGFQDATHTPSVITLHGQALSEASSGAVSFYDASLNYDNIMLNAGSFVVDCEHDGGYYSPPEALWSSAWRFMSVHPFGVEPSPYQQGLPSDFHPACTQATIRPVPSR